VNGIMASFDAAFLASFADSFISYKQYEKSNEFIINNYEA
jgi:hypothetical protein